MKWLTNASRLLLGINFFFCAGILLLSDDRVPVHFAQDGSIDRWGSPWCCMIVFLLSCFLYFCMQTAIVKGRLVQWRMWVPLTQANSALIYRRLRFMLAFWNVLLQLFMIALLAAMLTRQPVPLLVIVLFAISGAVSFLACVIATWKAAYWLR